PVLFTNVSLPLWPWKRTWLTAAALKLNTRPLNVTFNVLPERLTWTWSPFWVPSIASWWAAAWSTGPAAGRARGSDPSSVRFAWRGRFGRFLARVNKLNARTMLRSSYVEQWRDNDGNLSERTETGGDSERENSTFSPAGRGS